MAFGSILDFLKPLPSKMALLALLAVMVGCSTVKVNQDYDPDVEFSQYRTWQLRDAVQAPTGDVRVDNPLLNKRIRQAVENHLNGRDILRT